MNLQLAPEARVKVDAFRRKHRIGLLTLLFTDVVGSTQLKQELGDSKASVLFQTHHALVREILAAFSEAEEIETAGDSFFWYLRDLRMRSGFRCNCNRNCSC